MLSALLPALAQQQLPVPERRLVLTRDVDFPGADIAQHRDVPLAQCETACLATPACRAFTWNGKAEACFLKSEVREVAPYAGAYSGRVVESDPALIELARERAGEIARFISEGDLAQARALAVELANDHIAGGWTVPELLKAAQAARQAGNPLATWRFVGAAVVLADAADLWVEYARLSLGLEAERSSERRALRRRALSAAINGYLRAETPAVQANALVVMAEALEAVGRGRNMIAALRLAQALAPREEIARRLEDAVEKYGMRVVDHRVESDPAEPRICATFSEPLARAGIDYAPYVQMPGAEPTVTAAGRDLCIEGLRHGERYQITLRAGLPAASGEKMARSVTLRLYVPDRAPMVRFPGRAYVLPAAGEVALPVQTVNVAELELTLRRVSERTILRLIQEGFFGRPLSRWQERRFGDQMAETVWQGTGRVQMELNRDMTTRLPLGEIVGALKPGLYALRAAIPGADPRQVAAATQWFVVTDIGLVTMRGVDGLTVFALGLGDARPKAGVELTLLSRANSVLGTATTDAQGQARFAPGLMAGAGGSAPALLVAREGARDLTFLSLTEPAFDLSDRGVAGRPAPGPVDVFVTTDRGIYRAGETIHVTALARDDGAQAIEELPLIAVLRRPDGVEYARRISRAAQAGGHVLSFTTTPSAPRGGWRLEMFTDPDAAPVASTRFLIEDFLPERIDVKLSAPERLARPGETVPLALEARYLFGAPAAGLPVEGEYQVRGRRELEAWPGYRFGDYDAPDDWFSASLPQGIATDAEGRAVLPVRLEAPEGLGQPLTALVTARVIEAGRPVERQLSLPVAPTGPVIGIRPEFEGVLREGGEAGFTLIALDPALKPMPMQVAWEINRIERHYQWYQMGGDWRWEPVTRRSRVARGTATLSSAPVRIAAPVEWGRYEIRVARTDGAYVSAAQEFYVGWYGGAEAAGTPDFLEVSLDAESYRPGDIARLRLVPRQAGTALVTVMSNRLIEAKLVEVTPGENLIDLPVTDEWGSGAYVAASVIRPMEVASGHNPARALGLAHAAVDPGTRRLEAAFELGAEAEPRGSLDVALRVEGVQPGETAWATIAAVDLGILNLTGFEPPDPVGHCFGQRRLGVEIRDVYGRLIDGLNGALGEVRSGGDGALRQTTSAPPPEELVAFFSGPVQVGADGYARARFDLPAFNGTLRLMAVVWSRSAVGQASADVLVRDPVVVTATLPRFVAPGDRARLLLEVVHATGPAGRMGLDVTATPGLTLESRAIPSGLTLGQGGAARLAIPFTAGEGSGVETITVALTTPAGKVLERRLSLAVQLNDPVISRTSRFELAPGQAFTFDENVFAGFRRGTASATLAAGPIARLDAPGLLRALDRYPYGCTEQITSRALPLLYLSEVARAMGLGTAAGIETRIDQAIARVLDNQASDGSFGLWGPYGGDLWLSAYVTDFLSRAQARGHAVPEVALRMALDHLRNRVNFGGDFSEGGEDLAYALYVLAREGAAAIGDLRYYADAKADSFATPLAAAQLGAALAAYGERRRADAMFARALALLRSAQEPARPRWRVDYGSRTRDLAGVLTLAAEAGTAAVDIEALAEELAGVGSESGRRSTQEQAWSLLAVYALIGEAAAGGLTVNGAPVQGPLVRLAEDDAALSPVVIRNEGTRPVTLTLTSFGVPEVPEPSGGNGLAIERRYFSLKGDPVDPGEVALGTRLVTVLTVQPFGKIEARLIVDDPLPAGFEIDNPNLLGAGDVAALDWLELNADAQHAEFRQERFLAAVDWLSDKPLRLAYIVRAVTPGAFHHPAASVEDMYRPAFRAHGAAGRIEVIE
ncbi:MAG: alpha-2-macroglobulin family protein [Alphaproteobacteria bacterium]|nr:MAG: alpha-2-macroglobulin family protein [Alphaproteobacteria bacterium]